MASEPQTMIAELPEASATGGATTNAARQARRALQHGLLNLVTHYETEVGAMPHRRDAAERMWPAVVATQRLGYKALAACWSLEASDRSKPLPDTAALTKVSAALGDIIAAANAGHRAVPLLGLPDFLQVEITGLAGIARLRDAMAAA